MLEDTSKDKAQDVWSGASLYALRRAVLQLLVRPPLRLIQVAPVVGEHGIEEVHVGVYRLLGQRLGGLLLLALLLDQVLRERPVVLGLGPQVVDHTVEEVLRQLGVEFLGRDRAVRYRLVRFFERSGEFLRRFVDLFLLFVVHGLISPLQLAYTVVVTRYQGGET